MCLYKARKVNGVFCAIVVTTWCLCDFSVGFWNCFDSMVFIVFHFISAHDAWGDDRCDRESNPKIAT
jgi:hypothetical protein